MKVTFPTKGYGRIYCLPCHKQRVLDIIKSMDDFEYEYLPINFICTDKPELKIDHNGGQYFDVENEYTHKFDDLDLNELQMRCFMENIPIVCWIASSSYCHEEVLMDRIYLD